MCFRETFLSDQENSLFEGRRRTSLGWHADNSKALWTRLVRMLLSPEHAGRGVQKEPLTTTRHRAQHFRFTVIDPRSNPMTQAYHPHFTDEEKEALDNLPSVT